MVWLALPMPWTRGTGRWSSSWDICMVVWARSGEVARQMAMAAPQGSMAEIEDAYHHVMLDNPPALVRALHAFLAPIEPRKG